MELYLIRHAQSQNNERPEEERVEDPPLTALGNKQAACLAEWIPSLKLTKLITSPFLRTLETTAHICRTTNLVPEVWTDLHELGGCVAGPSREVMVGRPGMTREEIEQRFPGYQVADDIDSQGWWKCKPYEYGKQAERRAKTLLAKTRMRFAHTSERVGYVMHADFKRIFIQCFHSQPLDVPCNSSVSRIEISATENKLQEFAVAEHLPEELHSW